MSDQPNPTGTPDPFDGLPPELADMLRSMAEGRLDPAMAKMMEQLGMTQLDPGMLAVAGLMLARRSVAGDEGVMARIVEVSERTTTLRRTADDDDPVERVIVSNADQLVVVTALADTQTALETMVAIRDRVISAYEDILRMPM